MRRAHLPLLLLALAACSSYSSSITNPNTEDWSDPTKITYAAGLGIDLSKMTKTAAGVYYLDVVTGSGTLLSQGDKMVVNYTGYLPNGILFGQEQAVLATLDNDPTTGVLQGWIDGLQGMRAGGERLLVIPPSLAYGNVGAGVIPPNSTIIFDVQLIEVQ